MSGLSALTARPSLGDCCEPASILEARIALAAPQGFVADENASHQTIGRQELSMIFKVMEQSVKELPKLTLGTLRLGPIAL